MREILRFDDVSLKYHTKEGETSAIEHLSFSIHEGEFVAYVGPSGCGKTTLLSMIAGLLKPTHGTISLLGQPLEKPSTDIGYMLQRDQLFEWRTIEKNVLLGLELKKDKSEKSRAYVTRLLRDYGLSEFTKHYPRQLSGGMRQRVALIRTLAPDPKILLLDEPFSALDYQTRLNVCEDVFRIIKQEKKTAILVTHDISEAISMSDRVIVLSKRPAHVQSVHATKIEGLTPLQRRETAEFPKHFERIWKELNENETHA